MHTHCHQWQYDFPGHRHHLWRGLDAQGRADVKVNFGAAHHRQRVTVEAYTHGPVGHADSPFTLNAQLTLLATKYAAFQPEHLVIIHRHTQAAVRKADARCRNDDTKLIQPQFTRRTWLSECASQSELKPRTAVKLLQIGSKSLQPGDALHVESDFSGEYLPAIKLCAQLTLQRAVIDQLPSHDRLQAIACQARIQRHVPVSNAD